MDIALAANRRGVAQGRGGGFAGLLYRHILLGRDHVQRGDAAVPGAEHFCAEAVHAGHHFQPVVDIAAVERMHLAVAADILEQSLAGQIVDLLQYFLQPRVAQTAADFLAALGAIAQAQPVIVIADIADIERGRPLAHPRAAADPDRSAVDQPDQGGNRHILAPDIGLPLGLEQFIHLAPDPRQPGGKFRELVEFLPIAIEPPLVMIAILLARRGIKSGRLDMAIGFRADPHVGVGGRDAQLLYARQLSLAFQRALVGQQILKPPPPPDPRDAGFLVAAIDEAGDAEFGAVLAKLDQGRGPAARRSECADSGASGSVMVAPDEMAAGFCV